MPEKQPTIFAAVLAAGRSSRFGSTKQAAEIGGVPLLVRATTTATDACDGRVVTVIGHDWETLLGLLQSYSGFVVVNEAYAEGLGTSIASAARACRARADALLFLLADQPLITAQHLKALIDKWSGATNEIVVSSFAGTEGPPVLFARDALQELIALTGDRGARSLFDDDRFRLRTVPFEAAAIDIDTPADLAALS